MVRIALRAHRTGFLVTAGLLFLLAVVEAAGYAAGAGTTPAEREAFGRQMTALAPQVAYLLPLPIHPETLGGFVQWRAYGAFALFVAFWPLFAATGSVRNEEERGLLELWLAAAIGRPRLLGARVLVFGAGAIGVTAAAAAGAAAGAAIAGGSLDAGALLEVSAALLGLTLACYGVGLLAAQLAGSRRGAAALGGAVLLATFFLDSLTRLRSGLDGLGWISPFHLYNATTALAPGGRFDATATVTLFGIAAALVALAFAAFQARDLYAPLAGRRAEPRAVRTPSANPLLRVPVLSALYEQRVGLFAGVAGTALTAGFMLSLTRSMNDLLINNPTFRLYLGAGGTSDPTLITLGLFWFGIAALIVVIFAVFQVGRWAADDAEGRLEMTVAQPVARWRVVAERFLVLAAGAALLAAAGSAVIAAAAPGQGIHLDGGRFLLATVLLVPLALTFGALGAALTARVPRLAVPVLATVAVIGYFIPQIAPLFRWPDWALDLSFFRLYGSPLTQGVFWTGLWAMAAVTVVGFGVGLGAMRYREIGR